MAKPRRGRARRLILDIGSSAIRLCELSQTKTGYQLTKYYQREVLNDPSLDEEKKQQQRREALATLLKEAKVRTRKTILAVPGRSVFTRPRTLPPVPEYKVTQIVRYEIQQQIPFRLDQIALDYQILDRTEAGGYDVLMAAIKVDVIEKHLSILENARCTIDAVDVCPFALYNWLKHTGEFGTEGGCVAVLDMGASTTDIVIERENQFAFTRPLNLGGDDLTAAIGRGFGLNFADAEKLKRQRAFAPTGDPKRDGKAGEVLDPPLSRLVGEISRSFGYFRSLPGGRTVDRVVITGGGACLRNIVPYLQRQLGVEVRIAQSLTGLVVGPAAQQAKEHPQQACVALGMALRCCGQAPIEINLIPPKVLEAARRREQAFYWILSFIALALIAASIIPDRANEDKRVRERVEKVRQYVRQYDPEKAEDPGSKSHFAAELGQAKRQVEARMRELRLLGQAYRRRFWLDDLKLLNDLRPEGGKLWFSSIETSTIQPGRQEQGGGRPGMGRGRMGMSRSGAGSGRNGIRSSGFSGLTPVTKGAQGMDRRGDRGSGFRGRSGRVGGSGAGSQATAPPKPNGYRIYGYAKDPETLTEFIDRLKQTERFAAGVHFSEANVSEAHISELSNARVSASGVTQQAQGDLDEDTRGGRFQFRSDMMIPSRPQSYRPLVGVDRGLSMLFFFVDVQFEKAAPPRATQPAAGAGPRTGLGRRLFRSGPRAVGQERDERTDANN